MASVKNALVIGGGVAGPIMALALRKAGIAATVFERHPADADGVGGTLAIAPNGLAALDIVGVGDAVRAAGLPMTRTVIADGRGRRIGEFASLRDLPPTIALWRSDLQRALHEYAVVQGVEIIRGKRLLSATESEKEVEARFADGSSAKGDLIIGADGVRSVVRALIDPAAPAAAHVPLLNFAGTADLDVADRKDAMYFVFGRRAFLGYWAQPDGTTAWYANVPDPERVSGAEARSRQPEAWLSRLREAYAGDLPADSLLRHTAPSGFAALGSLEIMPPLPHWHRGRMVVVGDAVHAPSPSSGQGASLAVESAIELARCLRDVPDLERALARYVDLRRRRVERVAARAARTNGAKALGPVAIAAMRLLMPVAVRTFLSPERILGPEQRYRIEWERSASTP